MSIGAEARRSWWWAAGLGVLFVVAAPALGQAATGQEIATAESQAAVTDASQMRPYYEVIPGTDIKVLMVPIPGGVVRMGSPETEAGRTDEAGEGPVVEVRVEPFWMSAYEVTWAEYGVFGAEYNGALLRNSSEWGQMDEQTRADAVSIPTLHHADCSQQLLQLGQEPDQPATVMSQFAARQYTKWLSMKSGRFYRLPTEAEWEHASRAGTTTAYFFGDEPGEKGATLGEYAWFTENSKTEPNPDGQYHPVGKKKPNPWGLYDIYGNVAEHVIDQQQEGHRQRLAVRGGVIDWRDAIAWPTADQQFFRVVKGGGWNSFEEECRSAFRLWSLKEWNDRDPQLPQSVWNHTESFDVGFRIIRPLGEASREERMRFWEPEAENVRRIMFNTGGDTIQKGLVIEH